MLAYNFCRIQFSTLVIITATYCYRLASIKRQHPYSVKKSDREKRKVMNYGHSCACLSTPR